MTISPDQAAETLREVARTQKRSVELSRYHSASPLFLLWGVAWILGYGSVYLLPERPWLWDTSIIFLGVGGSFVLRYFQGRDFVRRFLALAAITYSFLLCAFAIFPSNMVQHHTFIPLVFAAIYAVAGLWAGWRYSLIGIAVGALTMGGFFLVQQHLMLKEQFLLWMAVAGGGTLLLTGFWLRRA